MNKTYVFSAAGVAEWQADLAAVPASEREAEATLVAGEGLQSFLPTRFDFNPEQMAYLDGLEPALCQLWTAQIVYAIMAGIPIELDRPDAPSNIHVMNTKYIESEDRTGTDPAATLSANGGGYYLRFTIGY